VTLQALARDFAERQQKIQAAKGKQPTQVVAIVPLAASTDPMPERLTPEHVVQLWAAKWQERSGKPPDLASVERQQAAAKWLAQQDPENVVRALWGIARVFPFKKGEAWNLADVQKHWDKALAESDNHPDLVDARTAKRITERMNGAR
jgi:hypothetical protein